MRVLVLHNRRRATTTPSGEDRVVDVEVAALRAAGHDVDTCGPHSGDIKPVSLRAATLPATVVWNPESYLTVRRVLRRLGPDVVHIHNTFPLLTPSVLAAAGAEGVPVVVTLHNYGLGCPGGELLRDGQYCNACVGRSGLRALRHACFQHSRPKTVPVVATQVVNRRAWSGRPSAYIFLSRAQRRELAGAGFPPERCFVKWNLVPDVPVPPALDGPPYVAYLGRWVEAKGVDVLMRAWEQIPCLPGGLRLVIAGGGPLEPTLRAWAAAQPAVDVVGGLPPEQARALAAGARAVVVPSTWREPFGLVAVEAMAAGVPVIASRHGALPELVTDGVDGALCTPGRPGELAAHLRSVALDAERWAAMGRAARSTYLRAHDPAANVEQLVGIYRYAVRHPA